MQQIYISALSKYRTLIIMMLLLIVSFFIYNIKFFQLDASSDTLILEQDNDLKKYRSVVKDYETSDFLIITFTDKEKIITSENLSLIKLFINKVENLQWVQNTQSIFDVPLLEIRGQKLTDLINEVLTIESPNIDLIEAETELLNSPIFKNLIISEDASSTASIINFKKDTVYEELVRERERLIDLNGLDEANIKYKKNIDKKYEILKKQYDNERHNNIYEMRSLMNEFDFGDLEVHLGGVAMIADDTITFVKNDIIVFGIGALFLFYLFYLLYLKILYG